MAADSFRLIVHQSIHPGGLEEFSRLARRGASGAEANEPGTLGYEFFINEEGSDCYLNEYYADSEAFLTHFQAVQPILAESMKVSTLLEVIVLGDPSQEVQDALAPLRAKYYSNCIGFCR